MSSSVPSEKEEPILNRNRLFAFVFSEKLSYMRWRVTNCACREDFATLDIMKKETRTRIIIIAALVLGYVIVAILRSGTAW